MFDLRPYSQYGHSMQTRLRYEIQKYRHHLRRYFFRYAFLLVAIAVLLVVGQTCNTSKQAPKGLDELEAVKKQVPQGLSFRRIVAAPQIENLTMIGEVYRSGVYGDRLRGILLRALRFQNITQKVEYKYNLPENLLLAMVMQESMGVDLLPNSLDDGGAGLCHMQPSTASEFGLRIMDNCRDLRNFEHGKKLREQIRLHNYDKSKLVEIDDRFHPILNLDAAGRMLWYYKNGPQHKSDPIQTAIYRYAGFNTFKEYYKMVEYYRGLLNDPKVIDDVRQEFNRLNPDLKIDGRAADFDDYLRTHQQQHRNYGLDKYK